MRRVVAVLAPAAATCTGSEAEPAIRGVPTPGDGRLSTTVECSVTAPNGAYRDGDPAGLEELGYGNGKLWVGLSPHGRVEASIENVNRRGEIVVKFPWDRGVRGRLHVSGQRIDG
jgi:hypothetical protein